jgi:hypothetical protein
MKRVLVLVLASACAPELAPAPPVIAPDVDLLQDDGVDSTRDASCPSTSAYVVSLRARVLDERGAGIEDAAVQLCTEAPDGRTFCLAPAFADPSGLATVEVAESARCITHATARVLVPGSTRPAVYCDVPLPLDDATVTVAEPYVLLEGHSDLDGVTIDVDLDEPERLAARVLRQQQAPLCVQRGMPDGATVVAFAPDEDADALFAVDVALDDGPVQVWARGALSCTLDDDSGTHLAKGAWTRLDDGVVQDGVATGALPCLAWLALTR